MRTTLVKHGNSYALVIDQSIMELLKITPGTELDLATDGRSLIITPSDEIRDEEFRAAVDKTHKRYGRMLKRLAE